jgi:hypothetical protein
MFKDIVKLIKKLLSNFPDDFSGIYFLVITEQDSGEIFRPGISF